jgi:hypothetical protein
VPARFEAASRALRQVVAAAPSIRRANAASSAPAHRLAEHGARDGAGQGRGRERRRVAPAHPAPARVPQAGGERPGGDDDERGGGRRVHVLVEGVHEDRDGEHGSAAAEHADRDADDQPEADRGEGH